MNDDDVNENVENDIVDEDIDPMTQYISQAWSIQQDGQFILLIFIAALLGLGKGGVPGLATVATAMTVATSPTHIVGGLGYAVALQVPILSMIDISASWLHSHDIDWGTIRILLPLSFIGMAIGQWLDQQLSDSKARLLVGLFLLLILTVQLSSSSRIVKQILRGNGNDQCKRDDEYKTTIEEDAALIQAENGIVSRGKSKDLTRRRTSSNDSSDNDVINYNDEVNNRQRPRSISLSSASKDSTKRVQPRNLPLSFKLKLIWAMVVGIVGGAATMLTNAMGPILNVYLLSVLNLSPTSYIGTRAMFFCFLNIGKIPMRFYTGSLGISMIPLATVLGMVSILGVFGAKPIMLSMSESNFVKLELAVVAFSGLRLCWMGLFP